MGRPELFERLGIAIPEVPEHDGPIAWLLLADTLRQVPQAPIQLRELGLHWQLLLTGDRQSVADAVAEQTGITSVVSKALPKDKLHHVNQELQAGFRPIVVGDGINDSLALKAGAVGVAMGAGRADISLAAADIVLTNSDLRRLGTCVRLSRECRRTLQWNVVIGLGWTLALVVAAAFGLFGAAG